MTLRRASTVSFRGPRGKVNDEEENKGKLKTRQSKEFSEQGKVKWDVYKVSSICRTHWGSSDQNQEYAINSNLWAVAIFLVTLIGAKTAEIGKCLLIPSWEASLEHARIERTDMLGR